MSELKDIQNILNKNNDVLYGSFMFLRYYNQKHLYNQSIDKFSFANALYDGVNYHNTNNSYTIVKKSITNICNYNENNENNENDENPEHLDKNYTLLYDDKLKCSTIFNAKYLYNKDYKNVQNLVEIKSIYIDIDKFSQINTYITETVKNKFHASIYKAFCKLLTKENITLQDLFYITNNNKNAESFVFNLIYHIILVYFKTCLYQKFKDITRKKEFSNIFMNTYSYWKELSTLYTTNSFVLEKNTAYNNFNIFVIDTNQNITDGNVNTAFLKNNNVFNEYMFLYMTKLQYSHIMELINTNKFNNFKNDENDEMIANRTLNNIIVNIINKYIGNNDNDNDNDNDNYTNTIQNILQLLINFILIMVFQIMKQLIFLILLIQMNHF
jgi:hypothetical protein